MPERHLWTLAATSLLVLLAQAPARASAMAGLDVSVTLVTGASLPAHALITTGVIAPASHTSSRAHLRPRRHVHHRHLHQHPVATRSTLEGDWPVPSSPRHHGVDHRAALPSTLTQNHRSPTTSKQGMVLPAAGWPGTDLGPTRLAPETGYPIARLEGRTISGRGPPPRAPYAVCLPPRSPAAPPPTPAALPVPTEPYPSDPAASAALTPAATPPHACATPPACVPAATLVFARASRPARPFPRTSPLDPGLALSAASAPRLETEPVLDRSLARRPEGTTACFDPPSPGETA